ncbi:MAG: hypothetical protein RI564_11560 [Gracilimonas sp.]|nr:hypothetical protein [Gracilimonas sp.]
MKFRISQTVIIGFLFSLIIFNPDRVLGKQIADQGDAETERTTTQQNRTPHVFIDCSFCDFDHIRNEIPFVNYVRDPKQADIHVFITRTRLSRGGAEYELSFIGLGEFSQIGFDLSYTANRNETWSETRDELNHLLKSAFMPYISQTALNSVATIAINLDDFDVQDSISVDDPWNYWVFEAYVGSVNLGLESNKTDFSSRWGLYADKVTEEWKLRFRPYFNYSYVEIQQEDSDPVKSTVERHGLETYAIKSINDHWSAGLFANYLTRNDRNIRNRVQVNPGIEYSLLPYEVATRKAITFRYLVGYTFADYFEETIFGVTQQNLLSHQFRASVDIEQPWGSVGAGAEGSHYFHDATLRRTELFGNISVRIVEGLSVRFYANYQKIQDQLTLPAGNASLEDVLLQRRELATDFSFYGSVAITYTFGSDFANIVNTRF